MLELKDLNDQDRNLKPKLVSQVIHTQRSLGKVLNRLPGSTALPEDLVTTAGDEPAIHGGFSQVRRGRYGHREVAVKSLPLPTDGDPVKIRKIWKVSPSFRAHFTAAHSRARRTAQKRLYGNTLSTQMLSLSWASPT